MDEDDDDSGADDDDDDEADMVIGGPLNDLHIQDIIDSEGTHHTHSSTHTRESPSSSCVSAVEFKTESEHQTAKGHEYTVVREVRKQPDGTVVNIVTTTYVSHLHAQILNGRTHLSACSLSLSLSLCVCVCVCAASSRRPMWMRAPSAAARVRRPARVSGEWR